MCQGAVTSGFIFKFYLNEVLTDIADTLLRFELIVKKENILWYTDVIAFLAPA